MPLIDILEGDDRDKANAEKLLLTADFDFCPQVGHLLALDVGYWKHYKVVELWYRQDRLSGLFRTCVRVTLDD